MPRVPPLRRSHRRFIQVFLFDKEKKFVFTFFYFVRTL